MEAFEKKCLEFLKEGREAELFLTGYPVNINSVLGIAINYAHAYFKNDNLVLFDAVYQACARVESKFLDDIREEIYGSDC